MNKTKQLDSYSMLIVSKYLKTKEDFINSICVCNKFKKKKTTEKLRFNPIPITSLKLFPNIQTQYLYNNNDIKIDGIDNYEICYTVTYDQYLKFKEENIKYHNVVYTHDNRLDYGDNIPEGATIIGQSCFYDCLLLEIVNLPLSLTSLSDRCFCNCSSLKSITLPSSLLSLSDICFCNCSSLKSINLSSKLTSLGNNCFYGCSSLKLINFSSRLTMLSSGCFLYCISLTSINIPSSIISLGDSCFKCCTSLEEINGMENLKIGYKCFYKCNKLKNN
ncbi:Leucine rich repeat containing protein BspA family protein [Entamoeba marina]